VIAREALGRDPDMNSAPALTLHPSHHIKCLYYICVCTIFVFVLCLLCLYYVYVFVLCLSFDNRTT